MSAGMKGLKDYIPIMIFLFVIMVVVAVTLIGTNYLKGASCETYGQATYYWTGAQCQVSETNTTAVTVDAVTEIDNVKKGVLLAISLLTLLVLIVVFGPIIRTAMGISGNAKNF